MTTMIEKVARAVSLSQTQSENMWQAFLPEARAAIEAMREPTPAIIEAAEDIVVGYDDFALGDGNIYLGIPGYPQQATEVWQQFIDAALKEQP